jgi:hypothetical protein
MSEANALWGAPRIHGELQKLGLEIAKATVSKYLARRRTPPSQTWRTFLANHVQNLVAVDFFTVPTVMFKVSFVFVVLAHARRRVLHVNVTDSPTVCWTAQQLVEAFPWDTAPRYLLRDDDGLYGVEFSSRVLSRRPVFGLRSVVLPGFPWVAPTSWGTPSAPDAGCPGHWLPVDDPPPLGLGGRSRSGRGDPPSTAIATRLSGPGTRGGSLPTSGGHPRRTRMNPECVRPAAVAGRPVRAVCRGPAPPCASHPRGTR